MRTIGQISRSINYKCSERRGTFLGIHASEGGFSVVLPPQVYLKLPISEANSGFTALHRCPFLTGVGGDYGTLVASKEEKLPQDAALGTKMHQPRRFIRE